MTATRAFTTTTVALMTLCASAPATLAQSFSGIGDLPGGLFTSDATAVSADGSVVVGKSWSLLAQQEAFRWTQAGGMVGLGVLPGGQLSVARAVSADGSVVIGNADSGVTFADTFRWTAATGMVSLGDLPGGTIATVVGGVSADGSVVVGLSSSANSGPSFNETFRWTAAGGMVGLGDLPGGLFNGGATNVSPDGAVVVGYSSSTLSGSSTEAFRWTATGGMVGLGDLPGGPFWSVSRAVSADGSVVVGDASDTPGIGLSAAFRWTAAGGMVGLGDLPGGPVESKARDVSADGSIVVGASQTAIGFEAFIWDATNGMRSLRDVLVNDLGLNLTGWTLTLAEGISDNGSTIVGVGRNPSGQFEGWIATLIPTPSCTPADMNNDGAVNGSDIARFLSVLINQNGTAQQICAGDLQTTPNGSIGLEDVANFVTCLLAGGC